MRRALGATNGLGRHPETKRRTVHVRSRHLERLHLAGLSSLQQRREVLLEPPRIEETATQQRFVGVAPQAVRGGIREGDGSVGVSDGSRLAARAEHRVQDAQTFLGRFSFGDVLHRADGTQRAPSAGCAFEIGLRAGEHPAKLARSIDDTMLDVEQALSGWVVSGLDRRADARQVLRVNVADDFRQIGGLVGVPAVHAAQLRRPVQRVSQVIVLEDADVAGSNRLAQAFIGLAHTESVQQGRSGEPNSI